MILVPVCARLSRVNVNTTDATTGKLIAPACNRCDGDVGGSELREAVAVGVWFVGMVTLLMRAQAHPRTPGIATRIDTHHLQVGKGRRFRFQNSQVPPIRCMCAAMSYVRRDHASTRR